jgi:hypothetical protein
MAKPRTRCRTASSRARRQAVPAMGVVDQVVLALRPSNRLATLLGFVLGGVVPIATYVEAHLDLDASRPLYEQVATFLVVGGLMFSGKTVFAWAERAFRDAWKAAGFVLLLEGVMITSNVPVLPLALLCILVAINGIATGCVLSLDRADGASPALAGVAAAPAGAGSAMVTTLPASWVPSEAGTAITTTLPARRRRPNSPQEKFTFDAAS